MTTTDRVYEFVLKFRAEHQVSPTIREMMLGVGLSSTSVAAHHVNKLIAQGRLRRAMPGQAQRALIPATQDAAETSTPTGMAS